MQIAFTPEEQRNAAIIERAHTMLDKHLPLLEKHLSDKTFLTGDKLTVADIHGATVVSWAKIAGHDYSPYPNICAWIERQVNSADQQKINAMT